jgi:hypothetical protein
LRCTLKEYFIVLFILNGRRGRSRCSGPLGHENAENPNAARFQHLLGTLSISFGILHGAGVGRVGGCRAQSVQPNGGRSLSLSSRERLRC